MPLLCRYYSATLTCRQTATTLVATCGGHVDNPVKMTIRIPDDLHTALVAAANDDTRSLNAEIIVLLREALKARLT